MILVTGGAGFIGSNLVASLSGESVAVCDRLITREVNKTENLRGCEYELVDPHRLGDWLSGRKMEAVIHLGAITDTRRHDGEVFAVNFCLSTTLFAWCTKHRVPFIYASSAATYGAGDYGFSDNVDPSWLRPLNTYGWSKHVFDRWVLEHGRSLNDAPPICVGLRLFNVYGPRERHKGKMASIITQKMDDCREGRPVTLFRSHRPDVAHGEQKRDFVHVDDVCSVIVWFLTNGRDFGIYNVGTGHARSFRDAMIALAKCFGRAPSLQYVDMPEDIRGQYQYHTEADIRKLRQVGYAEEFLSLEDGIKRTVQSYDMLKAA